MAVWQYDFHLVPRTTAIERVSSLPARVEDGRVDDIVWWRGEVGRQEFEAAVSSFLGKRKSWHPAWSMWGREDGDRIDIALEGDRVGSCFVRVDLRNPSRFFIDNVLALAHRFDCVVLTDDDRLIEAAGEDFWSSLRGSSAWRFVQNPRDFLAHLDEKTRCGDP